ncbi:hypothetical protein NC653_035581 [Populus alba x Populus x berolinensis]|uniref:Uncharacterized protein n=1 Tax=Populus alba x Populus x berolinensis TaxID=444605 RepID=A0AAD6LQB8_9ROSI|nr:hypothetical protein NC653_035581 [Populus alba x Populus x berolinensis]
MCALWMTVLTVYVFLYGRAYLAFSGLDNAISVSAKKMGNTALDTALNAQFLVQIGVFTAIPMIMGFILELGLLKVFTDSPKRSTSFQLLMRFMQGIASLGLVAALCLTVAFTDLSIMIFLRAFLHLLPLDGDSILSELGIKLAFWFESELETNF